MPTLPNVKLSLERWRQLAHIPTAEFYNLSFASCTPPGASLKNCNEKWQLYGVDGGLNYFDLANQIDLATKTIVDYLGKCIYPRFICDTQTYPADSPFPPPYNGHWPSYSQKCPVQEVGRETEAIIGQATQSGGELVFSDNDGDGFKELATITITAPTLNTSKTCWLRVFTIDGVEIKPVTVTATAPNLIITIPSYVLINPDLYSQFYSTDAIDACTTPDDELFVNVLNVKEIYPDSTQQANYLSYKKQYSCGNCGSDNCDICTPEVQTACLQIVGDRLRPVPADYSEADGFCYLDNCSTMCRPDNVEMYYFANPCQDADCTDSSCVTDICSRYEMAVFYLATTRLTDICQCSCGADQSNIIWKVQREVQTGEAVQGYDSGNIGFNIVDDSPFGVRWGEMMAYRSLLEDRKKSIGWVVW